MLDKNGNRQLAYLVQVDNIVPIPNYDKVEHAIIGGWKVIVQKGQFNPGDIAIYFEIDSKVPADLECFSFLAKRHYKIKTLKMCKTISQGLLMHPNDFGWEIKENIVYDSEHNKHSIEDETRFVTDILKVVHIEDYENAKSVKPRDKYKIMMSRHPRLFQKKFMRKLAKNKCGQKILYFFLKPKKDKPKAFPKKFPYIKKTDQERCENMPWVLKDKTPFIRTQKCDGSSATYILERKPFKKFEFYVCSRNVRMLSATQENYFEDSNPYWEMATKYDIKNKLKDFLNNNKNLTYICWQGEICGPKIQKNPQQLEETHLFLFHMIDSEQGFYDIRDAKNIWNKYGMESVPIEKDLYILPDNMEDFKLSADGLYDPSVCEGKTNCAREGFVYYKSSDPNFSFKNVSRTYLLKEKK